MSANNYILIKENPSGMFNVSERDYESDARIKNDGSFLMLRQAIQRAEMCIRESEWGIEYGIRFSFQEKRPRSATFSRSAKYNNKIRIKNKAE